MCSLWIVYYKDKFIIAIIFFLSLAVFRFILNKLPLNDIKYQLCYLKRCLYTQKFYLFIVTIFFYYYLFFFCVCWKCILLPKGINEFVVFLCIVHVWFWFFTLLPIFLLLVIKGQFFSRTKILFQSAFFFSYKNVASKSFYKSRIHLFPLILMQRNEMWYTYTPLGI
jgi:hypothetical protein